MNGKYIMTSVGLGGMNNPMDVATVQYLLNCVPISHGGPIRELKIDGIVGVFTIQAINRFQNSHFGWSDGRVDTEQSGGVTIVELKEYDPLPFSAPVVAPNFKPSSPVIYWAKGALKGKKHSGGPGRPATAAERTVETPRFRLPGKGELKGKRHSGVR